MHAANGSTLTLTLIAGIALLVSPACTEPNEAPVQPRADAQADSEMHTIILDVTLPEHTAKDQIEAIAHSVEALAGAEVVGAKVKAQRTTDGPMILSVEVWGSELELPESLIASLRAEHPELVDTPIAVEEHDGAPVGEPLAEDHEDLTPAQAKAGIIEKLRAQGVEGEIDVNVVDDEHGRRVEVQIEDEEHVPEQLH